jgi:hypothetical protein
VLCLAVWAGLTGCTRVNPAVAPGAAGHTVAPPSAAPDRPDGERLAPSPQHPVLATAAPKATRNRTPRSGQGGAGSAGAGAAVHPFPTAGTPWRAPELPKNGPGAGAAAALCRLGETYGNWAPDSQAATICHHAYGR